MDQFDQKNVCKHLPVNDDCRYFDENGMMTPGGENGILFTAEYVTLAKEGEYNMSKLFAYEAIKSQQIGPHTFQSVDKKEPWSHDNHTGMVCMSKIMDLNFHKKFFWSGWWRRAHPRDVVFYLYMKGGIIGALAWFFLWIPMISMIVSCATTYKVRGARRFVATDGKLLTWLRCKAGNLHLTYWICSEIISRKEKFGSWYKVFKIYFKHNDHPNVRLAKELYEKEN